MKLRFALFAASLLLFGVLLAGPSSTNSLCQRGMICNGFPHSYYFTLQSGAWLSINLILETFPDGASPSGTPIARIFGNFYAPLLGSPKRSPITGPVPGGNLLGPEPPCTLLPFPSCLFPAENMIYLQANGSAYFNSIAFTVEATKAPFVLYGGDDPDLQQTKTPRGRVSIRR